MMEWHNWLVERMDINKEEFGTREDIENEAYRICLECIAEGNKEEADGYYNNLCDEYGDYERDYKKENPTKEVKEENTSMTNMDYSKHSDNSLREFLNANKTIVKQYESEIRKNIEIVNKANNCIFEITEEINKRNFKI